MRKMTCKKQNDVDDRTEHTTIGMTLMTEQNTKDKDARMTDRNYTNTNSRQNTNRQTGQDKARPRQTSIQQI